MAFEGGGAEMSDVQSPSESTKPNNNEVTPEIENQDYAELGEAKNNISESSSESKPSSDLPKENKELPDTPTTNDANQNSDIPGENNRLPESSDKNSYAAADSALERFGYGSNDCFTYTRNGD